MCRRFVQRDLIELASDQRFSKVRCFKASSIEETLSFPVQINMSLFLRPELYVHMGFVWLAAMTNFVAISR